MVSLRSFCRFGYLICFRKRSQSYSSKANRGFVCFQDREIRCKLPQGLTRDNTKSWSNSGTDKLQAFATFDVFSHWGMSLWFCGCQRFAANHFRLVAWVSWLLWYRLGWIPVGCSASVWQIDALAVKTSIAAVWWVAGNIFAARKGCGASDLMVRRKVLLNTSWSTLLESLGEKGFENSSKLGFS